MENKKIIEMVKSAPDTYPYSFLRKGNWTEETIRNHTVYLCQDRAILFFNDDTTVPIELVLDADFDPHAGKLTFILYEHNWKSGCSYGNCCKDHQFVRKSPNTNKQINSILDVAQCQYSKYKTGILAAILHIMNDRKIQNDLNNPAFFGTPDIELIMKKVRDNMIANPRDKRIARIKRSSNEYHFCIIKSGETSADANFQSFLDDLNCGMSATQIKKQASLRGLIKTDSGSGCYQRNLGNLEVLKTNSTNPLISSSKVYEIVFSKEEADRFSESFGG